MACWQRRWRKSRQYGLGLVLRIACVAVAVCLLIRLLSLPKLIALLDAQAMVPPRSSVPPDALVKLAQGLLHIGRPSQSSNCMIRSLTVFYFLRRWGHPVRLYFGIARRDGALSGHCWLELYDAPLAESVDPRQAFTTVVAFPPGSHDGPQGIPRQSGT